MDEFDNTLSDFRSYLVLERSLSPNTVEAYSRDYRALAEFLRNRGIGSPWEADYDTLSAFLACEVEGGLSKRSQARLVSSLKTLFRFLDSEGRLAGGNPCERLDTPHIYPHLPDVLTVEEIESMLASADQSGIGGRRDRTILEVLYSCGLRVSELVNLRISDLFLADGFVRVTGKGNKQRLVPIGEAASKSIELWMADRALMGVSPEAEDILFLNMKGGRLSRVAVFNMVKALAAAAGISKSISPHTFRHSFASHLVENGADLRAVQEMLGHESILTTEIYTHIDTRKWQQNILAHHPVSDYSK